MSRGACDRFAIALCAMAVTMVAAIVAPTVANAGRLLVVDAYGDPAVRDEAGAVTILVRAALHRDERPVVGSSELDKLGKVTPKGTADALKAANAQHLVFMDVSREGIGLRAGVLIYGLDGKVVEAGVVKAGDGDVRAIADGVVSLVATATKEGGKVAAVSLGELRGFLVAQREAKAGRAAAAADALVTVDPLMAQRVSAARDRLDAVIRDAQLPVEARLATARALGIPRDTFEVAGTGQGPAERAARARAHLITSNRAGAEAELAVKGPPNGLVALARAELAILVDDDKKRDAALVEALELAPRETLAFMVSLPRGALPESLERAALNAAEKLPLSELRVAAAIGLRLAEAGLDLDRALALISVRELNDDETARLERIVAPRGSSPALRLIAEIAMRRGDEAAAAKAIDKYLGSAPSESRAHLYKGRLFQTAGEDKAAAIELERASAPEERMVALFEGGDHAGAQKELAVISKADQESLTAHMIVARLALEQGRADDAVKALRIAEGISPANPEVQHLLANSLEAAGDKAGADEVRLLAESIDPTAIPELADLAPDPAAATEVDPNAPKMVKFEAAPPKVKEAMNDMLRGLPQLPPGSKVIVVELASSAAWYSLRDILPGALRAAVISQLVGRGVEVLDLRPAPISGALSRPVLDKLIEHADAAVLYHLAADGGDAKVRLVQHARSDDGSFSTLEISREISGDDLVTWDIGKLVGIAAFLMIVGLVVAAQIIRGSGEIEVRIKTDPNSSGEAFNIEIAPIENRPEVPDPRSFREQALREGQKKEARMAQLVGPSTRFKVAPGTWWVHLYGVFERAGEVRVLDPSCSRKVEVKRGHTEVTAFDLAATRAEIRISVYDKNPAGVSLWLDDSTAKIITDEKGEAVLFVLPGEHTLHVQGNGISIDKVLTILAPRLEKVQINLERERRLAEVSEGLSLQKRAVVTEAARDDDRDLDIPLTNETAPAGNANKTVALPGGKAGMATAPTQGMVNGGAMAAVTQKGRDAAIGDRLLGRYKVIAELGRGAMGVVVKAWDENLEREVAVKLLSKEIRQYPEAMSFFVQEAKALAQLNHPNIVSVFDQTADKEDTYLILEFVDGTTLERLIETRGKFPWQKALGVIDQLCAGLAYAHGRRVIHRDIKPANIFISKDGVIKLGDFGLAKVVRELSIRKTEVRGTPLYMAPEQITGTNIDHRSDIYAVGCTLFELLTGKPPFTTGDVLYHHMHTVAPRARDAVKDVPKAVDELIAAMIEKTQDKRIGSAADVRERIRAAMKS